MHPGVILKAFTRNLGYRTGAEAWLRARLDEDYGPDIVFAQEVLPSLLASPPRGYQLIAGREEPRGAVGRTSVLLVRNGLIVSEVAPGDRRPFGALGTYVAPARLLHNSGSAWLVSVHTSPSPVPLDKRRPDFGVRSCEREPWWADAFLAELKSFVSEELGAAVIAGDLNQARAYDKAMHHTCGGEILDGVTATGFVDVTSRDWNHIERPTPQNPDYQLDRVFVSEALAGRVAVDEAELEYDGLSDHVTVQFVLDLEV